MFDARKAQRKRNFDSHFIEAPWNDINYSIFHPIRSNYDVHMEIITCICHDYYWSRVDYV